MIPGVPRATYRLQFHSRFTLADATALIPYLARLGVSHIYASPLLHARAGSLHGYDIVDHGALNPEIGSAEEFRSFCATLRAARMGLLLDIVPNHMAVGGDNAWWQDVLEHGQSSLHERYFDIDWAPPKAELRGKVLLPVLGDHYGNVLDAGDLELTWDEARGVLAAACGDARFPLDPQLYPEVIAGDLETLAAGLAQTPETLAEFAALLEGLAALPPRQRTDALSRATRARDGRSLKERLGVLIARSEAVRRHVGQRMARFSGPGNVTALHEVLERQAWRLAYWRTAADEVNYRRFFDVSDLAALRQEDPEVFSATHAFVLEAVGRGDIQGVRIDHPDGLRDPAAYTQRLDAALRECCAAPVYVVAEKILGRGEQLPRDWAVHGTTGYDWLATATGLFIDGSAEPELRATLRQAAGRFAPVEIQLGRAKHRVMRRLLGSELTFLAWRLNRLSEADRRTRDYTLMRLREALAEVAARFPVYRSYVTEAGASTADRASIEGAIAVARKHSAASDLTVYDFLRSVLLFDGRDTDTDETVRETRAIALRFQQFTAPLMAKAFEDTLFYRYPLLLALNEVGSDPRRFSVEIAEFHADAERRARDCPASLLATSTHDTKRSEDARMRLCTLTEFPQEWHAAVHAFRAANRALRRRHGGRVWPSRSFEYLLYQSLVSIWPAGWQSGGWTRLRPGEVAALRERVCAYARKAAREAKQETSWSAPNHRYEEAVDAFVVGLLPDRGSGFMDQLCAFVGRVARPAAYAALSLQVLKLTCPGVPDIYQGTEAADFSLVDPDNRRPVDFRSLASRLDALETGTIDSLLDDPCDGRAKLFLTARTLRFRARKPALLAAGEYLPLRAHGSRAEHLCAYARCLDGERLIVIASRWVGRLLAGRPDGRLGPDAWRDTWVDLPAKWEAGGTWTDLYSGIRLEPEPGADGLRIPIAAGLSSSPVALFTPGRGLES